MNTLHSLRTSKKLGFILVALMLAIASVGSVGAISAPGQTAEANNATIQIPVGLPLEEWEQIFTLLPDTSISQQAYLKASNTEMGDYFGNSVAISGDTVVVGAHDEDSSATGVNGDETDNSAYNSGAAYVFTRMGHNWSQQAYLKASNTDTEVEDYFGYSVAISGDTIVVGAFREASNATGVDGDGNDNSASASGAAYVFTRSGDTWSQQAYLKASNTGADDYFGISVAISGDTIVVGAAGEASNATGVDGDGSDNSADFSGAAYVFTRSGSTWSQQAYLKASNARADDWFGHYIAIGGSTIVVGAPYENSAATGVDGDQEHNAAPNAGATYVFAPAQPQPDVRR